MRRRNLPTVGALSCAFIRHPMINEILKLRFDVSAVERLFPDDAGDSLVSVCIGAVPPYAVDYVRGPSALHDKADGFFIPNWAMRDVSYWSLERVERKEGKSPYQAEGTFRLLESQCHESNCQSRQS
jgi:hypothetical protein